MLRFRLYSTITPGYQLITFLLSALPLNISLLSREFPIGTLFRFSIPLIIQTVFYANIFEMLATQKKRRRSLVPFISGPRVARSYFLCDSISAAGTLTQDSLLLLPSHNTDCFLHELIKEKGHEALNSCYALLYLQRSVLLH